MTTIPMTKIKQTLAAITLALLLTSGLAFAQVPAEATAVEEPAEEAMLQETATVVEALEADGNFTVLVAALQQTGLADALAQEGPFTVFAPTDAAFQALPEGTLASLGADQLAEILTYHVVAGAVTSADVAPGATLTTLQGEPLMAGEDGATIGDAALIATDMEASNGVVHAIDTVLMPPADDAEVEDEMDEEMDEN